MVNIEGIDKAELLVELYNNAKKLGLGVLQPDVKLTVEDARKLLEESAYFDYLNGKVLKVDLSSDKEFDETLYDRDNGVGIAQFVINGLRLKKDIDEAFSVDNNGDIHILDEKKFVEIMDVRINGSIFNLLSDKFINTGYNSFYADFLVKISNFNSHVERHMESKYPTDDITMEILTFNFSNDFLDNFCKQTSHNRKFITELFCTYANKAKEKLIPVLNDGRMNQKQYNSFVRDLDENIMHLERINQIFDEIIPDIMNVADNGKIEVKDDGKLYELLKQPDGANYVFNYIISGKEFPSFDVTHGCGYIFRLLADIAGFLDIDTWEEETANDFIITLEPYLFDNINDYVDKIPSNILEFLVKLCTHYFEMLKLK